MAQTNADRQALHRAKQAKAVSDMAEALKQLTEENADLRKRLAASETKAAKAKLDAEKKIASLKDRLLAALERVQESKE